MRRPMRPKDQQPAGAFLLAPGSGFRHYRLAVLAVAVVSTVAVVLIDRRMGPSEHHLPPVESFVVLIAALAGALAGVFVGVSTALAGILAAFLLLADFTSTRGTVNAFISGAIWILAAVTTGYVGNHLRRQVTRREAALEQALSQSQATKDTLEHLLDVSPHLQLGETLADVVATASQSAIATFGADGARIFQLRGKKVRLLAISPASDTIKPGFTLSTADYPDFEIMLAKHRPLFVRDVGETGPTGQAAKLRDELGIVSTVRVPIVGPGGPVGMLSLSWQQAIDRPDDNQLAIMQRFADQTALAWHNALRIEAQHRANDLRKILERLVKLAPSFHITGTREKVAQAVCQAALATFECSGAALYQVEGDRLQLLYRLPKLASLSPGRTFPLTGDMQLARDLRSSRPTFVADVTSPGRAAGPWPPEALRQAGTSSALHVPLRLDERGPSELLVLTWTKPKDSLDEGFLVVVQRFADQASLALANSSAERLHARLEASLLPTAPVEHPSLEVITRYRTGEQRLRLGGDFVGSTVSDDGVLSFVIGDVSGHGPDAAALGATLRSTWKALTLSSQPLTKIPQVMTDLILAERNSPNAFATILIGRIDTRKRVITWINAGHMPPLLIADQVVALESRPTPPLGITGGVDRKPHRHQLPESWSLFCYTDGLIDARFTPGSSERYGEDRLRDRLAAWTRDKPDAGAVDALFAEVESASGSRFADDVAALLICTKDRSGGGGGPV